MCRIKGSRIIGLFFLAAFVLSMRTAAQPPGGYRLVSNEDPEALAAARFAAREEGQKLGKSIVLASMVYAQRQVVSGTNFKLCLKVKVNGTSRRAETVVFRDLQKQYTLTGWKWGECTKPEELRTGATASPSGKSVPAGQ